MAQWLDATVSDRIDWNDHLFSLRFDCAEFPTFKAGQFTKVGIEIEDGKVLSRPYSLVNSPNDPYLEIVAVPVEEGKLSPALHALKIGDSVKVMSPATGFLILDEVPNSDTLWLLATGTGVGPFLSILHTEQVWQEYQHVVLVYGVRFQSDLAYLQQIEHLQSKFNSRFSFVPIVTREESEGVLNGRIPELIRNNKIQTFCGQQLSAENSQIMLCGNPDMIKDTLELLEQKGMTKHLRRSPGQISMERYW